MRLAGSVLLLGFSICTSQSRPADFERFEVASIRPSGNEGGRPAMEFTQGGIRATNVTLKLLIELAYDVRADQVAGGPNWAGTDEFTIVARSPEGGPALPAAEQKALTLERLQTLLRERFRLVLTQASPMASVYALMLAKPGSNKMKAAAGPGKLRQVGRWQLRAEGADMATLSRFLSARLKAPVTDRTGLSGFYNFSLNWTPDSIPASVEPLADLPEHALIPAVREQLGLKLERRKLPSDRYQIEHAEKPTEN